MNLQHRRRLSRGRLWAGRLGPRAAWAGAGRKMLLDEIAQIGQLVGVEPAQIPDDLAGDGVSAWRPRVAHEYELSTLP